VRERGEFLIVFLEGFLIGENIIKQERRFFGQIGLLYFKLDNAIFNFPFEFRVPGYMRLYFLEQILIMRINFLEEKLSQQEGWRRKRS